MESVDTTKVVKLPQVPAATYQSSIGSPKSRRGSVFSVQSLRHSHETTTTTIIYDIATPQRDGSQCPPGVQTRTNSEVTLAQLKGMSKTGHGAKKLELLTYILFVVPGISFMAFFYTLLTLLPLGVASLCSCSGAVLSIQSVNGYFFDVHAHHMQLGRPKSASQLIFLNLCSPLVSILAALFGLFSAISWSYSFLLAEKENQSSSLDRAISFWYAWVSLFCVEPTIKGDQLV